MVALTKRITTFSDGSFGIEAFPKYRIAWDDENPDYNFKCRTQMSDWNGVASPPAVYRYYPVMKEDAGDFRVDISAWKDFFIKLNNDIDGRKFEYWTGIERAQFNNTGWAQFAYLGMSGNRLIGEPVGDWFRFVTLKPTDLSMAQGMTRATHPFFIHTFTCVGFKDGETVRIMSTNTDRGIIDYPLITKEGFAYIPLKHVALD